MKKVTVGLFVTALLAALAVAFELDTPGEGVTWAVLAVGTLLFTYLRKPGEN